MEEGPSRDTLRNIIPMMRGFMVQKSQGKLQSPTIKRKSVDMPDHACKVCGAVWGKAPPESPVKVEVCVICKQQIEDGLVAIVNGKRFAFVKSQKLSEMAEDGVVNVSTEVMDKIGLQYLKDNAEKTQDPSGTV